MIWFYPADTQPDGLNNKSSYGGITLIEVNNLSYVYDNDEGISEKVLDNIKLNITDGEFVAVLGHNGSGK